MPNWGLSIFGVLYLLFFLYLAGKVGEAIAAADDQRRRKKWQDKITIKKAP